MIANPVASTPGTLQPLRTALLVGDAAFQRELSQAQLADAGFMVEVAVSAEAAIVCAGRKPPDIVLSEVQIGDVDGYELCRRLRAIPALDAVPIVLISATYREHADRVRAREVGAFTLVGRSPDFAAELEAIHRALAVRQPAGTTPLAQLAGQAHEAEERYRALIEHTRDMVTVIDMDGIILEVNQRAFDVLGYGEDEMVGRHIRTFSAPGAERLGGAASDGTVEPGGTRAPALALRHKDGRTVYVEFSDTLLDIGPAPVMVTIGRDVTAQIRAQRELAAAERRYRSILENMPDVLWSATEDGRLTHVSGNAMKVMGYTADEVIAQQDAGLEVLHPDDRAAVVAAFASFATSGRPLDIEYRRRRPDGTWQWIQSTAIGFREENGVRYLDGRSSDVTARRRLEEQLRQSQKLEAIGQLSGGVAHDFNNILAVILANSQFLIDEMDPHDPRVLDAQEILKAGERAAALTRQLLAFSRRQVLEPTVIAIDNVVTGIEKMLRRLIGEDIQLSVRPRAGTATVKVDIGQLEQVIVNLVVNARDAMPAGGSLGIESGRIELDELAASQVGCPPGRYAMLSVSDTGTGMDPATLARMFEPFFTTKEKGHGTGLGLSTCYGIVRQSSGVISVYSEVGQGSVFTIYLPQVDPEPERARRQTHESIAGGSETIILVEDDPVVRAAVSRMLECRGYRVLCAFDGAHAVELAREHAGGIELVLSDVILPTASGPEVVQGVKAFAPDAAVLFMSGYSDHAILRGGELQDGLHFIQKPFTSAALARKVRLVLDA